MNRLVGHLLYIISLNEYWVLCRRCKSVEEEEASANYWTTDRIIFPIYEDQIGEFGLWCHCRACLRNGCEELFTDGRVLAFDVSVPVSPAR